MSDDSSKAAGRYKSLGNPFSVIIFSIALLVGSQLLAGFVTLVIFGLLHPGQSVDSILNNSDAAQFVFVLIAEALVVAIIIWLIKYRRKMSLSAIGMGREPVLGDLGRALLAFGLLLVLLLILNAVLNALPGVNTGQKQDLGFTNLQSVGDKILAFMALVILPPLAEEPLMRGYLYSGLRARWKYVPSMLVTSLIFGAAHLEFGSGSPLLWSAAANVFVLSIILVYLREKTGAIWA